MNQKFISILSFSKRILFTSMILFLAGFCFGQQKANPSYPYFQKQGNAFQLMLNDKPVILLSGELGNSSASDLNYMKPIWQKLKEMNLNSVLVPVYWELIEPEEGKYDFTLVDSIIFSARINEIKIVFLWFGSWKNSMSCYAPCWVKANQNRFPRARLNDGKAVEILSPFSEENKKADVKIFSSLMKHIRTVDEKEQTVIMVQVENEIGMIPDARDYSEPANIMFNNPVPKYFINYLQTNKESLNEELLYVWKSNGFKTEGSWEEIFGKGLYTDEIFMAWYFADYTNEIAKAGKNEYPLPMFVNAALNRPNYKPGQYPSAGPLPHLKDIWKAAAPQIDFLAPDIYFKNFSEWIAKYNFENNSLFIPEVDSRQSFANAFFAIAQYNAIGYSPFSIESLSDAASKRIANAYQVLEQLEPLILENQGKEKIAGVLLDSAGQKIRVELGGYVFNVKHEYSWSYAARSEGETPRFGGMIIMTAPDEFYIAGSGLIVTFESRENEGFSTGIASLDEGCFKNNIWIAGRRMNGDQSHQGRHMHLPGNEFGIQKVKLYKYK